MAGLLSRGRAAVRRRVAGERGAGMIIALMVTLVVYSLGAVWIGIGTHQAVSSGRDSLRDRARNAAEAGLNATMGRLAADPSLATLDLTALPGAEFEVSVLPVSEDPADTRRSIVAKGYAPSKAHTGRVARRLEQQVDLLATDGFRHALFAGAGGVTGANLMTVNGDVYSPADITLSNNATVSGSVVSLGKVTTQNNSTISGDVRAAGNVVLDNPSTTVLGNVYSGGNVTLTGRVKGSVQAAGTITGGTVDGARAQNSPPPAPPSLTLPAYSWNPANYPAGTAYAWTTPGAFQTHWNANKGTFGGHHRVSCAAPCGTAIDLDAAWTVTDDVTIAGDGPITLSRAMANAAGRPVTLTIVSLATGGTPAITMSNNVTVPDDIRIVLYAPNGSVTFSNLKHFSGTVYANTISLAQQFTLTFAPVVVPGFDWRPSSASHFQVRAGPFREVPFS